MMTKEIHAGIICISMDVAREIFGDVLSTDSTDIQGLLREKGVFATVRARLLLPETYQVQGIYYSWMYRQWNIAVEGPGLPVVEEGMKLPYVTPVYQRNEDGSNSLMRIDI